MYAYGVILLALTLLGSFAGGMLGAVTALVLVGVYVRAHP